MNTPLISIVIPTVKRPQYLPQAIQSALDNLGEAVEVIVVPNGPDTTWKDSLRQFNTDDRVLVSPIEKGHANAARNHGMLLARGTYIRFLDDDDLIYSGASIHQCMLLESNDADICSGTEELANANGIPFRLWSQPVTDDLIEAILSPARVTAINVHVFRLAVLSGLVFDESISLGQDTHWMHQLCQHADWKWIRTENTVGVWRHHTGPRISSSSRSHQHLKVSEQYLSRTIQVLIEQDRLGPRRKIAAAAGLWNLAHKGYYTDPIYWAAVIRKIQKLFPGTYPDIALYRSSLGRLIPPLALEAIMLPKRRINNAIRRWNFKRGKLNVAVPP